MLALVIACQTTSDIEEIPATPPARPLPTMNHAAHLAKNMTCDMCHDPNETGKVTLPELGLCWDCHLEDPADWPEKFKTYAEANRREDGSIRFVGLEYSADLKMDHAAHASAKVSCEECHGQPSEKAFGRAPLMELKRSCMGCHEQRRASNDCATCHEAIREYQVPPSHDESFVKLHGRKVPAGWRRGEGGLCALCHETPAGCNECHTSRRPASHLSAVFRLEHGREVDHGLFRDSSCALCHEEESCVRCHQTEKPRSHTVSFERRLHGVVAGLDRESCRTCHQQESCDRCHRETRPLSHRGSWGRGRQTHCLGCHEPLTSNGCFACHKNTLGHRTATPMPPGWPHNVATQCRECHMIVPHADPGGDGKECARCHRILR
jgi:hypothetical protein